MYLRLQKIRPMGVGRECKDEAASKDAFTALHQAWSEVPRMLKNAEQALWVDEVWQLVLEVRYQRGLAERLCSARRAPCPPRNIEIQAVFCIDVRSEPMRCALEAVQPGSAAYLR